MSGLIWTDLTNLWYQANWVSSFRSPHANQTPSNIDFDTEPASLLKKPQIFPAFSCSPGPSQKQQKICWHFSPGNKFKWINISAGTLGWPNRIRKMTLFLWDCPGTEERSLQICDILSCTRHWPEAEGSTDQSEASIILADQSEAEAEGGRCARDQTQTTSMEASAWPPLTPRSRWWGTPTTTTTTTTTTSSAATAACRPTAPAWAVPDESGEIHHSKYLCRVQIFSTFPIYFVIHKARVKSIKKNLSTP